MWAIIWKLAEKLFADYIHWAIEKPRLRLAIFIVFTIGLLLAAFFWLIGLLEGDKAAAIVALYFVLFGFAVSSILWKNGTVLGLQLERLQNICGLLSDLPDSRPGLVGTCEQVLADLVRATAGSSFGPAPRNDLDEWRASILVYDGMQLRSYALFHYPPGMELFFMSSVCWKVFTSHSDRYDSFTCPANLDKHSDFVREALRSPVKLAPSKSMACVRIETKDGFRIGTLQVVSPKLHGFNRKKIKHFMHASAEIVAGILILDKQKKRARLDTGIHVYIFDKS